MPGLTEHKDYINDLVVSCSYSTHSYNTRRLPGAHSKFLDSFCFIVLAVLVSILKLYAEDSHAA